MKAALIVVALFAILSVVFAASYNAANDNMTFEEFLQVFPQEFTLKNDMFEYATRQEIFAANMQTIRNHNKRYQAGQETWFMRVNQFAAMTNDEIMAKYTGFNRAQSASDSVRHFNPLKHKLSRSSLKAPNWSPIDWNDVVDTVNQGGCGSCWANAAAVTLGGRINIKAGQKLPLPSRQAITSCAPNPHKCGGTGGCQGSTAQLGWDYVANFGGIATEKDYPYTSGSGSTGLCYDDKYKVSYKIAGFEDVTPNNREALLAALKEGPVSVSAAASGWSFYGGGIFSGSKCNDLSVNHAITLVATSFDSTLNMYSYTIKNSWGSSWGEGGNMRLYMAPPTEEEACGTDPAPFDGSACQDDPNPRTLACGCNGILFDSAVPVGIEIL
eukprot:UN04495